MKGLLNNPKFVILLAAGALFFAASNIFMPLFSNDLSSMEENVPPAGLEPSNMGLTQPSVSDTQTAYGNTTFRHDEERNSTMRTKDSFEHSGVDSDSPAIGWTRTPIRDPFRFIETRETKHAAPSTLDAQTEQHNEQLTETEALNVNAVVIGPHYKLAVVDGQLVKEGEIVLTGRINALSSAGVEYRNTDGTQQVFPIQPLNLEPARHE